MNFKIRNYRKISAADIELSPLTMIFGKNAAGKTSLIDAIRSVASANINPFKEITKKEISMLVHSGSPSGFAEMIDGENMTRADWPKCEITTTGKQTKLSTIATGINSFVDMDSTQRVNYIVDIMNAAPTEKDLAEALAETNIFTGNIPATVKETDLFKRIWTNIYENGWDNAYKQARENGVKLKVKWELITGCKKYGVRIAEQFQPEAWELELETIKEVDLIADVNKAKEWAEAAIKETAISDYEVERLTALSKNIGGIKKKCASLQKQQDTVEKEINQKRIRIRELSTQAEVRGLICPECKATLTLTNNELKKIPKSEYKKAGIQKAEIQQHEKDIINLQTQNKQIIDEWGQEKSALKIANDAALKLKNIEIKQGEDSDAKVQDVKNKLEIAEARLNAYNTYHGAKKIHRNVGLNKVLCDILAPTGLRNKKLTKALETINNSMKILTDAVGWRPVELNPDCVVLAGGVPYGRLIAKSERYRTRVLLQLMSAMAEKSPFVIVDDADELTPSLRNDLMKIILSSTIHAIVVCALDLPKDSRPAEVMPDISKVNGRTYWIEDGRIV